MDIRFRWLIPLLSDVCLMVAGILDDHLTKERLGSSSFVVFDLLLSCIGIFFTRLNRIVEKKNLIHLRFFELLVDVNIL